MVEGSVRITGQWETRWVGPGTPYEDDPSLCVPEGWYVLGGVRAGSADVAIHIHHASDVDGEPVEELVADLIAEVMRAATRVRR